MRTTITLDPDVHALVERAMRERGLSFKEAVNEAIRAGLGGTASDTYTTPRRRGLYAVDSESAHHEEALLAFIRIGTNPALVAEPMTVDEDDRR